MPVRLADGPAVLVGDSWVPQEPGRLRQARRLARVPGLRAGPAGRPGGPCGREHVRLYRGCPGGIDRYRARAGGDEEAGSEARRHRLHGGALRRRACGRAPRSRPGRRLRGAGRFRAHPARPVWHCGWCPGECPVSGRPVGECPVSGRPVGECPVSGCPVSGCPVGE